MEHQSQTLTKTSCFHTTSLLQIQKVNDFVFPIKMLPNEMQIQILSHLPTDDMIRCKSVCKQWQAGIEAWVSRPPLDYTPQSKKPLYFMFNTEVAYVPTCAYNSDKEKWIHFEIPNSDEESLVPHLELTLFSQKTFYISTSRGLVCFMDTRSQDTSFVFNPILKDRIKLLPKAPGGVADYCAITISTDVNSKKYTVAMVKSSAMDFIRSGSNNYVTIHLYKSETNSWIDLHTAKFVGWHGGDTCVICKDILYVVAHFPWVVGVTKPFHEIIAFDLSQAGQKKSLERTKVVVPCALTCVMLQNLNGKLIMVGGIPKEGTMNLDTIAIWELCGKELKEITRAPYDIISRFIKKIDQTFITSGCSDLVFIQSYTSRALVSYDFSNNIWKILPKAPLPLLDEYSHYLSGFCFEPLLDIVP